MGCFSETQHLEDSGYSNLASVGLWDCKSRDCTEAGGLGLGCVHTNPLLGELPFELDFAAASRLSFGPCQSLLRPVDEGPTDLRSASEKPGHP